MSNPPLVVVWDVDGTLVDTAEQHFESWQRLAAEIDKPFTRADFAATFGMRNPEIIRRLFEPDADDARCGSIGLRKESYYRDLVRTRGTELLPGVSRLLREFAAVGWMQAIGSSAPRGNLDLLLEVTGTRDFFAAVVSGEDVARGKPDPEVFLKAAERLGVDPGRCVVIEDAVAGVEAARAGRMRCVAVLTAGHHPADELRAAGADLVVDTLTEVSVEQVRSLVG